MGCSQTRLEENEEIEGNFLSDRFEEVAFNPEKVRKKLLSKKDDQLTPEPSSDLKNSAKTFSNSTDPLFVLSHLQQGKKVPFSQEIWYYLMKHDVIDTLAQITSAGGRSSGGSLYHCDMTWALAQYDIGFRCLLSFGSPNKFRWQAWRAIVEYPRFYEPLKYHALAKLINKLVFEFNLNEENVRQNPITTSNILGDVLRDKSRTFPQKSFFSDLKNQYKLVRILISYTSAMKETGYVQGMNFVAGFILALSNGAEEESFWLFSLIMRKFRLYFLYCEDFPLYYKIKHFFLMILSKKCHRLNSIFYSLGVPPDRYLLKWVFGLFSSNAQVDTLLPIEVVCRVWDYIIAGIPCVSRPMVLPYGCWNCISLIACAIVLCLSEKIKKIHADRSKKNEQKTEEILEILCKQQILVKSEKLVEKAQLLAESISGKELLHMDLAFKKDHPEIYELLYEKPPWGDRDCLISTDNININFTSRFSTPRGEGEEERRTGSEGEG